MYNHSLVTEAIIKQAGFAKSPLHYLAPSLLTSATGNVYNRIHPLLTYPNLLAAFPLEDLTVYPAYSAATTYSKKEVVTYNGSLYEALEDSITGVFNGAKWEKTNELSLRLKQVVEGVAAELVTQLMRRKIMEHQTKTLFENLRLFEGQGNMSQSMVKSNRFLGWMIDLKNLKDLAVRVQAIGLQLTQPNPTLTLYLYHTSQKQPLQKITLTNAGNNLFRWHELEGVILKHVDAGYDAGGSFILGYRESELVGNAIAKTDYQWDKAPCYNCSGYNPKAYGQWSGYVDIHPFFVSETEINEAEDLWDLDLNRYNYKTNYGLNMALSVECDVTDTIVRHALHFTDALLYGVAHQLLLEIKYSPENSTLSEKNRQQARHELDDMGLHPTGVVQTYKKALDALDANFSGLNSVCFPRQQPRINTRIR